MFVHWKSRPFWSVLVTSLAFALAPGEAWSQIRVHADFPGGSGEVAEVDPDTATIRLDPTDHPDRGWRCWWYVKLSGLTPGQTLTLDVGEAPWATPQRAAFSVDGGKSWRQSPTGTREGKRVRYSLRFDVDEALVAWGPPFVPSDAEALVERLAAGSPDARAFSLCRTREGRDTPALRIAAAGERPVEERPLIWIQARQHAWESGSSWIAKGLAEWIVSAEPEAVGLRKNCEIVVVPIMDIDNVQRGAGGKNQTPQDHNRDWSDSPHWRAVAAAQKEIGAAAEAGRLAAFVDLHNPGAGEHLPYFFVPPDDLLSAPARKNLASFLRSVEAEMDGSLPFRGKTIESGRKYDPRAWRRISKNWVAGLGSPGVAVTLETPWNTPASHTEGYEEVGRGLGRALARYVAEGFDD